MAGNFGLTSDDDPISGINVTPLVDVVLVLLIIFMITAPVLYQSAIKIQLPKAKTGEQGEGKNSLTFALSKDGQLSWNNEVIGWDRFSVRLHALGSLAAEETASISADTATPHGSVIQLMDALREVGLTRFALNVENR